MILKNDMLRKKTIIIKITTRLIRNLIDVAVLRFNSLQ